MIKISATLADFIMANSFAKLPAMVVKQAKLRVLDAMGVGLAGYRLMPFPRQVVEYFAGLGGAEEATMFGTGNKYPAINVVFANAACMHALDMDDGHRFGALHPGTVVVPAALAAAELAHTDTKTLISGVVAGYEVMIRVAMAMNPSSLNRGFHSTGIAGTFGSAAASANIMGLSREETISALGMAGLQSAGLLQVNHENEGASVKPLNPGRAATSGLFASIMAAKGVRGPVAIFEGEDGLFKAMADEVREEALTKGLGVNYEITGVYDKLYASCRHTHSPIDAALEASSGPGFDAAKVTSIRVETYPAAIRLAGITRPDSPSAARFSIPFAVAMALIKREASASMFCDAVVRDEAIQGLADRVVLAPGEKWTSLYPDQRGASVTINDSAGKTWRAEVALAKGEPENPASLDEIKSKFADNAGAVLSAGAVAKLEEVILNLDNETIDCLTAHLVSG